MRAQAALPALVRLSRVPSAVRRAPELLDLVEEDEALWRALWAAESRAHRALPSLVRLSTLPDAVLGIGISWLGLIE